ncbi:hypothetical protein NM688_g7122 [Phlebia brevispora]|uniref:Uncharacterized protein n=1 Tax=Phlebia brevispora TaxID=194682 RepID=A0ACC1S8T1_9APHY|nr:hypothetical protein NM688_g7122 [Phlebia brevispora]
MTAPRPIIIVTGANSGVGFGICHRLLVQLSQKTPPDAQPQFKSLFPGRTPQNTAPTETYDGLTLIMACRSHKRAEKARTKLLKLLDKHIEKEKARPDYDGHAERFKQNLEINFHYVDMSIMSTVFEFCDELSHRYPYISHLICNAGTAFWSGVDKLIAIYAILTKGLVWAITLPPFKLQQTGRMSTDGLGATWQANVFGHYAMYRYLQPMFASYARQYGQPARMIWMSSLEGQPCWYDHDDWQLVKTDHSYEGTKYQIDLISSRLAQQSREPNGEGDIVQHYTVHPGIAHSNMTSGMVYFFFDMCKVLLFYVARWIGSPNHTITAYEAAASATHIALVSLLAIPSSLLAFSHRRHKTQSSSLWDDSLPTMNLYTGGLQSAKKSRDAEEMGVYAPLKFSSETDRCGHDRVGAMPVLEWEEHQKEASYLVLRCESLYQNFLTLQKSKRDKDNGNPSSDL